MADGGDGWGSGPRPRLPRRRGTAPDAAGPGTSAAIPGAGFFSLTPRRCVLKIQHVLEIQPLGGTDT